MSSDDRSKVKHPTPRQLLSLNHNYRLSTTYNVSEFERALRTKGEGYWKRAGESKALKLFHEAAERVPAYKDFLKKRKINHAKVESIEDFSQIPLTTKENYIHHYPLSARIWDGDLSAANIIAMSSGTSGTPNYWPRGPRQEIEAALVHELIFRYLYEIHKYKTLMVIGFPMGVYVSGVATTLPTWLVSLNKKYPLTFATVGTNKADLLKTVETFHGDFDQIVLVGHPFPVKDLIETARSSGIDLSKKKIRTFFCSEGFTEMWRDYIHGLTGIQDWQSTISTYGSSEMLLMGHETPFTVMIRKLLEKNTTLQEQLGFSAMTPNIFQYNPLMRYIETVQGDLVFTSDSGIPLVRFNMKDAGQVIGFDAMTDVLDAYTPGWRRELKNHSTASLWQLPLITLTGRSDHTLVFYAANIYPEHVHKALNHKMFTSHITGKFVLRKGYKKDMEQYLELNIELRPGVKITPKFKRKIRKHVVDTLKEVNMEYLFLTNKLDKDLKPRIRTWSYQHPKYFTVGRKPKYIRN